MINEGLKAAVIVAKSNRRINHVNSDHILRCNVSDETDNDVGID